LIDTTRPLVSHDAALVKSFCGRALYLERGRVKAEGRPDVVTELYALDIRQAEGAQAGNPVTLTPFVGEGDGIAFGTGEGRIAADVAQPCLSVHDRQAREPGGAYFPIDKPAVGGGACRAVMRCRIGARLGAGAWSITLRLENRRSGQLAFAIDKQVGALVFEVEQPDRDTFFAFVDFKLSGTQVPAAGAP
jgi:homopolymeric O-antigen transport system ATP-binding protein